MEPDREHLQEKGSQQSYIGVQVLLNNLLHQMAVGDVRNQTELLYTIKQKWRHIDIKQFDIVCHYVTTMIAIMDESLKLLPAFPLSNQHIIRHFEGVYMTGFCSRDESKVEAWMFFTGSNEYKQRILFKAMHFLEISNKQEEWVLKAIDVTTGERFLRTKTKY
ncbi:hypothetical protein J2S78_003227 [Salibacterium salarium]|uniref:hypothetical protein n=1 Tax=Salibacterium salarium TaxID=284579 RepID=UPI002786BF97|nr:hypothetical protein [Salibacterium salarium]MDQ0300759.1 hypothetical protein [Salibacterium salarium]